MKDSVKKEEHSKAKRDLFAELAEGMEALVEARTGLRTLRMHALVCKLKTCNDSAKAAIMSKIPTIDY